MCRRNWFKYMWFYFNFYFLQNRNCSYNGTLNKTRNIVHPKWELRDPTPDIHELFNRFNRRFFREKLNRVKLMWRTGMTRTTGRFALEKDRRGRYTIPTIKLSKELLILRSRKYLIEVLLVSWIRQFWFVIRYDWWYNFYSMRWYMPICTWKRLTVPMRMVFLLSKWPVKSMV